MKTIATLFALLVFSLFSSAQVLCIKCYNQNARVLTDTNNLIVNGGFENTTCTNNDSSFCPNSSYYDCNIVNWICTGGGIGTRAWILDSNSSIIPEGIKAAWLGEEQSCLTCSTNDTSCMIKTGCEVTGIPAGYPIAGTGYGGTIGVSLSQTVNGLTTGAIYSLEFWSGGIHQHLAEGIFAVDVGFGNIMLTDPDTSPPFNLNGIGTRYVIVFAATSSFDTIKFTNWGILYGYNKGPEVVLDDVRLFASTEGNNLCATAVNDLPENAVATVFPNPATNLFTITTTSPQPSTIILYDITSRQLMQEKFIGSAALNIENLANGVYLYEVRDEKGLLKQGKVVKE